MKKYTWLLILIGLSLLPLFPLLNPGLPITHDGRDHVARIANFYQNLIEGALIPRWGGNLNWGYGHPVLMFLYPLPSYLASLFHFFGFSLVDSTKLVFGTTFVLSGVAMYLWLQAFLRKEAALVGALLYVFAPYRFVDLYVRGAIGEHVAFIFPPLVCYFLYKLFQTQRNKYIIFGGLATAGLILAHNAISLMFIPFIGLYALILAFHQKKKHYFLVQTGLMIIYGFVLSAFFWFPAFFEGEYTLRDIVSSKDYTQRLYPLSKFILSPWSFGITGQFSLQVGVVHWIAVLMSVGTLILIRKRRNMHFQLLFLVVIFFIFSLLLMIPISEFVWNHVSILQKFQFPWRFLSVSVFTTAVMGGLLLNYFYGKIAKSFVLALTVLVVTITIPFWKVNGYLVKPESFYSGIYYSTTDTGESSPIWSIRFMEETPKTALEFIDGQGVIESRKRTTVHHEYLVTSDIGGMLRENTVYFPGWKVMVDGKEVPVQFQDPNNRGVIVFSIGPGKHTIDVLFTETKRRELANMISLAGLLLMPFSFILMRSQLWKRFQ